MVSRNWHANFLFSWEVYLFNSNFSIIFLIRFYYSRICIYGWGRSRNDCNYVLNNDLFDYYYDYIDYYYDDDYVYYYIDYYDIWEENSFILNDFDYFQPFSTIDIIVCKILSIIF